MRMIRIEVLGPGCANCERLYRNTERAVKELGLDCELEKITDLKVIMGYRIMSTPGLVIDGVVKLSGRVPSVEQLKEMLS
jgi:small redox-active disulfide protein 2